jgi:hypothetical protein
MTSPYISDADSAAAVGWLRERFVGVPIWFGKSTGCYWAILCGQLVEAPNATELGRVLDGAYPAVRQPGVSPTAGPYGAGF